MTHRLVLGVDPGQCGAIALLADGQFAGFIDMPTTPRPAGGFCIDDERLVEQLREALAKHPGAYRVAALEDVSAHKDQGRASIFRFGESFGVAKCALGALKIPRILVQPARWKIDLGLAQRPQRGAEPKPKLTKAEASERARERKAKGLEHARKLFPAAATQLQRQKDQGRGDALLIAHWAELTEAVGPAMAAA